MPLEWKQKSWRGGYSDDRVVGIPNSFQEGKSVEIRKNPSSLKLAYSSEKDSGSVVDTQINEITTIISTGDIIAVGASGKIYRKAGGAGSWVHCYTDTGAENLLSCFEYNDYFYYTTPGHLNRIAITSIDADWTGDVTEDYQAFSVANANAHPMIELYNNLYIGDGHFLAELDSIGGWTSEKIEIFNDEEIRALTYTNGFMRFYTRKSANVDFGHVYYWNGYDDSHSQNVILEGKMVHSAICMDGIDYVLAGKQPILYYMNGTTPIALKHLSGVGDNQDAIIAPNAMDITGNLLLFGACASGTNDMGRGIWTYGQRTKEYTPCLNYDYPTSPGKATDVVTCIHESKGVIYQAWYDSDAAAYGIDKIDTSKYATSGYIITRVFSGKRGFEEKLLKMLYIANATLNADEKIEVFLRTNLQSSWGSPVLSLDYATAADRVRNGKRMARTAGKGSFNFIEMKIELTAGTSQATTPELFEAGILYNVVKNGISNKTG